MVRQAGCASLNYYTNITENRTHVQLIIFILDLTKTDVRHHDHDQHLPSTLLNIFLPYDTLKKDTIKFVKISFLYFSILAPMDIQMSMMRILSYIQKNIKYIVIFHCQTERDLRPPFFHSSKTLQHYDAPCSPQISHSYSILKSTTRIDKLMVLKKSA